jgi:hypothetical protein
MNAQVITGNETKAKAGTRKREYKKMDEADRAGQEAAQT